MKHTPNKSMDVGGAGSYFVITVHSYLKLARSRFRRSVTLTVMRFIVDAKTK